MKDDKLRTEYTEMFDNIHASDELKARVLNLKKTRKRSPKPFIAPAATAAAGIMIFAAVHNVPFDRSKPDDVISEVVTRVQNETDENKGLQPPPIGEPDKEPVIDNKQDKSPENSGTKASPSAETKPAEKYKTAEQLEREAKAEAEKVYEKAGSYERRSEKDNTSGSSQTNQSYTAPREKGQTYTAESAAHIADNPVSVPQESTVSESTVSESTVSESIVSENDLSEGAPVSAAYAARGMAAKSSGVVFRMNTKAALSLVSRTEQYQASEEAYAPDAELTEEIWENNRYFDYIGSDIISRITAETSFSYIGDDSAYFMVDSSGIPRNDNRIFAFSKGDERAHIITSRDTSFAQSCLSEPELLKSSVNGTPAVVFDLGDEYKCYMVCDGVSYIIDVYTDNTDTLEDILLAI